MGKTGLAATGLAIALGGQYLALAMAGGGHGWAAPFLFSLPLLIVYPIVLVRAFSRNRSLAWMEISLLMFGLAADVVLYHLTVHTEWEYFNAVLEISILPVLWIMYWLSWQILIAVALAAKSHE